MAWSFAINSALDAVTGDLSPENVMINMATSFGGGVLGSKLVGRIAAKYNKIGNTMNKTKELFGLFSGGYLIGFMEKGISELLNGAEFDQDLFAKANSNGIFSGLSTVLLGGKRDIVFEGSRAWSSRKFLQNWMMLNFGM